MLITTVITIISLNSLATIWIALRRKRTLAAEAEYQRALREYRDLVDHRIANPLTVIGGAVQTLLDSEVRLSTADRRRLLEQIAEQAQRIERVSLSPRAISVEEHCLRPVPTSRREPAVA